MKIICKFDQFVVESEGTKMLDTVLLRAEEGFYPGVQIRRTSGATSYVALSTEDGVSKVYSTENPREALHNFVKDFLKTSDPVKIAETIERCNSVSISFAVIPGDKVISDESIFKMYGTSNSVRNDTAPSSYLSNTPIDNVNGG